MDNTAAIRRLLCDAAVDASVVNKLIVDINNLYIDETRTTGVYCIVVRNAAFSNPGLCLVKFGRADDYAARFNQIGFKYSVVFKINGDNGMEKWFKDNVPCNAMKSIWPRAKVATIKSDLSMTRANNPGPKEWRVVSREFLDAMHAARITNLNYKTKMLELIAQFPVKRIAAMDVEFQWRRYNNAHLCNDMGLYGVADTIDPDSTVGFRRRNNDEISYK